jgi:hypothetical protein
MSNPLLNRIAAELRRGAATIPDLVTRFGCAESAVRRHIRTLSDIRTIYISHYRIIARRHPTAVYAWGEGADADPPESIVRRTVVKGAALPASVPLGPWGCVL